MPTEAAPKPSQPASDEDLKKAEAALRVEQDERVARAKAETEGSAEREASKKGVNPDG